MVRVDARFVIREARKRAGLTQAELAARAGTTQSAIARWESGAVSPSVESLDQLVRACGFVVISHLEPLDDHDWSLVLENLRRTPSERLDKVVTAARFIREGRAALADAQRG